MTCGVYFYLLSKWPLYQRKTNSSEEKNVSTEKAELIEVIPNSAPGEGQVSAKTVASYIAEKKGF